MKTISVLIPTYNEEDNVVPMCDAVREEFAKNLPHYDYEIIFIDNCSKDKTRERLELLCAGDEKVKAIFNARNFGQSRSPYYGLMQTAGDCAVRLCADFQEPVEMIHRFVEEWEKGYKIVVGIKTSSKESKVMYALRSIYYKLVKKFSDVEQIEHFTGFGLYDRAFIDVLRKLDDPAPFLRGIVAELGWKRKDIEYVQQLRKSGKSKNNLYTLYDYAMLSVTSYTKIGIRLAVFLGAIAGFFSVVIGVLYLILKLLYWDKFPAGTAPMLIGMMFLGAVQLFFIGMIGEYILTINARLMKRPLVIEEKRINF
ncbi:glycosyltransferase family 2 protein [Synergistes jonesii]|uniref:Glycosyl transferase n=1 Tax=Synergistes jonesii TaxID=2754 RepID=A0A073IQC8_9BACT|nr:glycosyltransferase family 2 protein [Synergistes jonesii]KEJ91954.1 glycosyl transferase [Synergistes jonesii]OFB61904.1 glycosyl transferase [Synergistes jonesii]OFB62233.1 glycosyl transferase [Synergistes jonesii]OFB62961.1 glycosyl transferase [Synergistes jonesii]OFB67467.1 glycosyl transferase [Synergistes jonesii]